MYTFPKCKDWKNFFFKISAINVNWYNLLKEKYAYANVLLFLLENKWLEFSISPPSPPLSNVSFHSHLTTNRILYQTEEKKINTLTHRLLAQDHRKIVFQWITLRLGLFYYKALWSKLKNINSDVSKTQLEDTKYILDLWGLLCSKLNIKANNLGKFLSSRTLLRHIVKSSWR